jgi:hypothetical protein
MEPSVYVKVVGFADVERHALNTVFRLSTGQNISYGLWTPEAPVAPRLALIDLDAYEAGLALASPRLDPEMKMICVGRGAHTHARHTFQRPLHWPDVVKAMDSLFAPLEKLDAGIDFGDADLRAPAGAGISAALTPRGRAGCTCVPAWRWLATRGLTKQGPPHRRWNWRKSGTTI